MMTEKPTVPSASHDSNSSPQMIVFGTIADTTWRMFVPVFLGAILGYGFDRYMHTRPTGVISGTFIGVGVAVLLVVLQYRQVTRSEKKHD